MTALNCLEVTDWNGNKSRAMPLLRMLDEAGKIEAWLVLLDGVRWTIPAKYVTDLRQKEQPSK